METAKGFVKSIADGVATVVVDRAPSCARCAAGKGCGAGLLSGSPRPAVLELSVPAGTTLRSGDKVALSVSPVWLLKAAFYAYGIPLLGTVLAAGVAWTYGAAASDLAAAGFAAAGLAGGVALSRYLLGRSGLCDRFEPHLEERSGVPAA